MTFRDFWAIVLTLVLLSAAALLTAAFLGLIGFVGAQ